MNFAQAGRLFEDLGITYIGLVPGHDIKALLSTFAQALELPGPVIVHVRTQKGHGFQPAETDQVGFHGAALPPMVACRRGAMNGNGRRAAGDADRIDVRRRGAADASPSRSPRTRTTPRSSSRELIELARTDRRIVGITAGMPTGTGLSKFQAEFPDRFVDVGIAEQHSVALATGLAMGGMRPVVALYSTFLQRAFDQTVHDVCQNDQPVLLAVDRAGLVGEDGTSHQGMFTLPAQRQLPNLVIASPKDEQELRSLLRTALAQDHPFALHYPRDAGLRAGAGQARGAAGRARRGRSATGSDVLLRRVRADRRPGARGRRAARRRGLVGRRRQRPLREAARPRPDPRPGARQAARRDVRGERRDRRVRGRRARGDRGGSRSRSSRSATSPVRMIGIPGDRFVDHGSVADLRMLLRLDAAGLADAGPRDAEATPRRWRPSAESTRADACVAAPRRRSMRDRRSTSGRPR